MTKPQGMNGLVDSVIADAEKEIKDEIVKNAKKKLVTKLRELKSAERLVANIKREINVIKIEMGHDLGQE